MKIVCVCLVLLVAVTTIDAVSTAIEYNGVGEGGVLEVKGYGSVGLVCAGSNGANIASVGCESGGYSEVSSDDIDTNQYEYSIVLTCTGNEESLSECGKEGGPAAVTINCNTYVGCGSK